MNRFSAVAIISSLIFSGCGGRKIDNDPTVFGFTPALRAEMRELIAASDPKMDANKRVAEFMDSLKKDFARELNVKPNAAGDYELPAEKEQELRTFISQKKPGSMRPIVKEFISNPPAWIELLLAEEEAGTITPERYELLVRYVMYNVQMGQAK